MQRTVLCPQGHKKIAEELSREQRQHTQAILLKHFPFPLIKKQVVSACCAPPSICVFDASNCEERKTRKKLLYFLVFFFRAAKRAHSLPSSPTAIVKAKKSYIHPFGVAGCPLVANVGGLLYAQMIRDVAKCKSVVDRRPRIAGRGAGLKSN